MVSNDTRRNHAAHYSEATMPFTSLSLGSVVVNFGTTAKVVGHFHRDFPNEQEGWPILREVGANGRLRGGKWVADPAKCEEAR